MRKRYLLFLLAGVMFCLPVVSAQATVMDASFTSRATAGIFEDYYDFFRFSPSYMASFKKNIFWSQFANMENSFDSAMSGASSNSTNSYYLLGGQADIGAGRLGMVLDWNSMSAPMPNQHNAESTDHLGFNQTTQNSYLNNGIIDYRKEVFGSSDATTNTLTADIYAAYALGGTGDIDFGFALRAQINSYTLTYDPYLASLVANRYTFNQIGRERNYNLLDGTLLPNYMDEASTGGFTFGDTTIRAILALRSADLIPGLDLVVNVNPIMRFASNNLSWNYSKYIDRAPGDPSNISNSLTAYAVSGMENNAAFPRPGNGFGVGTDIRGDYVLSSGIILTGIMNFETLGITYTGAKEDIQLTVKELKTISYVLNKLDGLFLTNITTDGKTTDNKFGLKLRAQFPAQGWRMGVGVNAGTVSSVQDYSTKTSTTNTTRVFVDDGNNTNDYTTVRTLGNTTKYTNTLTTDTLELPVGLIFDVLKNLNLQFGVKHTVTVTSVINDTQVMERQPELTTTTRDNGAISVATVINPPTSNDAVRASTLNVLHSNAFTYGLTWWPFEQTQVDLTGFNNLLNLATYRAALSIYF